MARGCLWTAVCSNFVVATDASEPATERVAHKHVLGFSSKGFAWKSNSGAQNLNKTCWQRQDGGDYLRVLCTCVATVRNFAIPIIQDFAHPQAHLGGRLAFPRPDRNRCISRN